jgi:hypothetical protein
MSGDEKIICRDRRTREIQVSWRISFLVSGGKKSIFF